MIRGWIIGAVCLSLVGGCAAHVVQRPPLYTESPEWKRVPFLEVVVQSKSNECASAVAKMVATRWGKVLLSSLVPKDSQHGIRANELQSALKAAGLKVFTISGRVSDLEDEIAAGRPVIVGTTTALSQRRYGHYKLVVGVSSQRESLLLIDPLIGFVVQTYAEFDSTWQASGRLAIVSAPQL